MTFVCIIQTAENSTGSLFIPALHKAAMEDGCLLANEKVLVLLSYKLRARILKCGLQYTFGNSVIEPVAAILAFELLAILL